MSTSLTDVFVDFRFRRFVTPIIIKIVYGVFVGLVLVFWLLLSWSLFKGGPLGMLITPRENGLGWGVDSADVSTIVVVWGISSLFYFLAAGFWLLLLRLALESIMVLFRIEEHLDDIAHK